MVTRNLRLERLETATRDRMRAFELGLAHVPGDRAPYVQDALALLTDAANAAKEGKINAGWAHVFEADRVAVAALSVEELGALADTLREEVREKLSGWRQLSALRVLGDPGTRATIAGVQSAMRTRDENSSNVHHKSDLVARHLMIIGGLLFVGLGATLGVAFAKVPPLGDLADQFVWASLLGALGGLLSAAWSLTHSGKRKIPEQVMQWPITLMRPIIGAAAGLSVFLLLKAGLVTIEIGRAHV